MNSKNITTGYVGFRRNLRCNDVKKYSYGNVVLPRYEMIESFVFQFYIYRPYYKSRCIAVKERRSNHSEVKFIFDNYFFSLRINLLQPIVVIFARAVSTALCWRSSYYICTVTTGMTFTRQEYSKTQHSTAQSVSVWRRPGPVYSTVQSCTVVYTCTVVYRGVQCSPSHQLVHGQPCSGADWQQEPQRTDWSVVVTVNTRATLVRPTVCHHCHRHTQGSVVSLLTDLVLHSTYINSKDGDYYQCKHLSCVSRFPLKRSVTFWK